MSFGRRFFGLAFLAASAAYSSVGFASNLEEAPSQRIRVHGDIAQHCAISAPHSVDFGDLDRTGLQADLDFGLNCNVPFVMKVEAQRGSLTNLEYPQGQGPYAGTLPYALDFSIPARMPITTVIRRQFAGRDLVGGKSISSMGGIATDGMNVHVSLGMPDREAGLLAGDYGETITLTLSMI